MGNKKIAIGCDHGGFSYKAAIKDLLNSLGYEIDDKGTNSQDSVDYPDFIHPVADAIVNGEVNCGIIMCGSGNGAAMTANKHKGVRAALCWTKELAELGRLHNNANILSIPVRFVSQEVALEMVKAFLTTDFEGGRHATRVKKIEVEH